MTYVQNTWVDQDVERPRTYEVNTNQDGSITLIDSFGVVTELGTPVNATNMNHIEGGIGKLYEGVVLYDAAQTYTNKSIVFFIDENNNVKVYRSLVNNNTGNPLTSAEYWEEIKLGGGSAGGVGSVQWSLLPQSDAGLHLLDGSLISGSGSYSAFVDYIAELYANSPKKSNVTKAGSLTDNNGALSGFSTNNYATTPQVFNPASNTWEQVWCFTTGSSVTSVQSIVGGNTGFTNPLFRITSNGYINMLCSTNNSSWDVAITGSSALSINTKYYVKGSFNGTEYKLELSTDGESFTTVGVVSSTSSVYIADKQKLGNNNTGNETFLGSIDLKESYINVNGKRWWSGTNPYWAVDEATWQKSVTTYGVCGKFVYDSVNNTVRLPKITGFIEGTIDPNALGDLVEAGLPNIEGAYEGGSIARYGATLSGAIHLLTTGQATISGASGTWTHNDWEFDASLSNSIYGNSNTVQPQAIKGYMYIVISNSTKTEIEVDIDEIATDLNGKLDTDLTNMAASQSAKNTIMSWVMPDYTNGITFSGTITMPCNALIGGYNNGGGGNQVGVDFTIDGVQYANSGIWGSCCFGYAKEGSTVAARNGICTYYPLKGVN